MLFLLKFTFCQNLKILFVKFTNCPLWIKKNKICPMFIKFVVTFKIFLSKNLAYLWPRVSKKESKIYFKPFTFSTMGQDNEIFDQFL
jgi:hypothetical protein